MGKPLDALRNVIPAAVGLVTLLVETVRGKRKASSDHRDISDTREEIAAKRRARDERMAKRAKTDGRGD